MSDQKQQEETDGTAQEEAAIEEQTAEEHAVEEPAAEKQEPEKTADSPAEIAARQHGWLPEKEFKEAYGDRVWYPAETFNMRGELLNHISGQNKTIKSLHSKMESMGMAFEGARKAEYERAKRELTAQRNAAIAEGDTDTADKLDGKLEKLVEDRVTAESFEPRPVQMDERASAEFSAWLQDNPLIRADPEVAASAAMIGQAVKHANPHLMGNALLEKISDRLKVMYPDKYGAKREPRRAPVVNGANRTPVSKQGISIGSLPPEYQKEYKRLVEEEKVMDGKELIDQWVSIGAIKI